MTSPSKDDLARNVERDGRCIFRPCVATWRHWHGGFPGGYDNPADPEGPPILFEGDDPEPGVVRDYNGAALRDGRKSALEARLSKSPEPR